VNQIQKHTLSNGLTVLIYPVRTIPKVAIQLWYEVGSKDEKDGERGLAHLLEHMIFKGTDILSESDINLISHKLSGNCNAFTGHDYTGYLFDFPKQNWHVALPLLANCMRNCTFKEDLLNAELKAVIQELKMYKDDYQTSLCEQMISGMFADHPYHYPIIGYKQDLWSINRQGLHSFYSKHYVPNNATLIIVGDVDTGDALARAQDAFQSIPAAHNHSREQWPVSKDIKAHQTILKRDVQQPVALYAWMVPGLKQNKSHIIDCVRWILGEGKGSRLYKKLVDELELATDLQVDLYDLFDQSVLFVHVDPIDHESIPLIKKHIEDEIAKLQQEGFTEHEFERACKQSLMEYLSLFENNQKLAYEIGKTYLSTKNEKNLFEYSSLLEERKFKEEVHDFIKKYLRVSIMNTGLILSLNEQEQADWLALQELSDKEDERILSRKVRESTVECGVYVESVVAKESAPFEYPHARKDKLDNGLVVLSHSTPQTPKIDIMLDLKVRHFYDPDNKEGLINFMSAMLLEGTQRYSDQQLADAAESRGMGIDVRAGMITISTLKEDFEFALNLLHEIIARSTFPEKNIEKVRGQLDSDIAQFWDNPSEFVAQLARSEIYQSHPYCKNLLGDQKSIKGITRKELIDAYKKYCTPVGARLAIVGDLEGIDISGIVTRSLGQWSGPVVMDQNFPQLSPVKKKDFKTTINRDQTVLCFAGLSVKRLDDDFDALLLFDQVFTGGVLGSMSSYLFQLREQTGLFYTIGGSLVAGADEQPGMVYIRTVVSNDRLKEAEQMIEKAIVECTLKIQEHDIAHARNALVNSLVDHFESNNSMAEAFLFIDRFGISPDYFKNRLERLKSIRTADIEAAVKKVLDPNKLVRFKIGRVAE
jgi:zinc protease